nr:uncharacterized protein LOC109182507 [Ipomoea batatas]GMD23793.1 uncharacterized protein LOC109182507 [Ipomoea batatas]GME12778.1 uncharacterized protein LOC109182507 [Ipomoea batatas]GME21513.1 uncharacterized protein LOC109182507 [Ipomoea batatas]
MSSRHFSMKEKFSGLWLRDSDDHTLKLRSEDDLASQSGVLVQNPSPRVPLEHVLFIVGRWGELLKPLLSNVDLALSRTSIDLFEAVGSRVNQSMIGQRLKKSLAGEADHAALMAIGINGEEVHDPIGHLSGGAQPPSIYEVLSANGLPMGLIPSGVTDYTLDDYGRFEVHLGQACNVKFENEIHFDMNVSGVLRYGQMEEVDGIAAQDLFLWFPVKGIRVDVPSSGLVYFDVGVVSKEFSFSSFDTPRECTVIVHPEHILPIRVRDHHDDVPLLLLDS